MLFRRTTKLVELDTANKALAKAKPKNQEQVLKNRYLILRYQIIFFFRTKLLSSEFHFSTIFTSWSIVSNLSSLDIFWNTWCSLNYYWCFFSCLFLLVGYMILFYMYLYCSFKQQKTMPKRLLKKSLKSWEKR